MYTDYIIALHEAVEVFKEFQRVNYPNVTEETDNGEWEIGDEFDRMYNAAWTVLKEVSVDYVTVELLEDMLYALARDNEWEDLIEEIAEYPRWFECLCEYCLKTNYYNAKWQFAKKLREYQGSEDTIELIFAYLECGEEYTERMALQSLAEMYPDKAEEYAVKFWSRNIYAADEYQKMMALYALDKISSPLLEKYLCEAEKTDYKYLKNYAEKLGGK